VKGGKQLKALSIHPYFAGMIFAGKKTVECRTWKTDYRGDILICSTAKRWKGTISGHALCVVRLADVVPFEKKHLEAACMQKNDFAPGLYAWILTDLRIIRPIPLKGKLSLWNYDGEVEILEEPPSPIIALIELILSVNSSIFKSLLSFRVPIYLVKSFKALFKYFVRLANCRFDSSFKVSPTLVMAGSYTPVSTKYAMLFTTFLILNV
jgi:hypothetical protein